MLCARAWWCKAQELRALREARESLDDQIERLEWSLGTRRQHTATHDESDSDMQTVRWHEHTCCAECEQDGGVSLRLFPRSTAACKLEHPQRQNLDSLLFNRPLPTSSPSGTRCVRATGRCCSVTTRAFTAPGASSPRRATPTADSHTRWASRLFLVKLTPIHTVSSAAFTSSPHHAPDCCACATCSWSAMRVCIPGTGLELHLCMIVPLYCTYELCWNQSAVISLSLLSACSHVSNMIFYSPNKVRHRLRSLLSPCLLSCYGTRWH